jgi:hypothetical protein
MYRKVNMCFVNTATLRLHHDRGRHKVVSLFSTFVHGRRLTGLLELRKEIDENEKTIVGMGFGYCYGGEYDAIVSLSSES